MVSLEFAVDADRLAEDTSTALSLEDAAVLQLSYFEMPVRLRVNGADLLALPAKSGDAVRPYAVLPLLDVALVGHRRVVEAISTGSSEYVLPNVGALLRFETDGQDISIHSSLNEMTAIASVQEVISAFGTFGSRVRILLKARAPDLAGHSYWGRWIMAGDTDVPNPF